MERIEAVTNPLHDRLDIDSLIDRKLIFGERKTRKFQVYKLSSYRGYLIYLNLFRNGGVQIEVNNLDINVIRTARRYLSLAAEKIVK
ncbi:hypothetical protein [Leptospira bandrabouensis]|uniref:Uncharacterized protein n=1 Tax=Leptospira bandrabouensis TaxID=2484903 RepID=A0A6H3NP37_9LEPT|nr:hypothetical protein [Leptospira bandrabouensis]TGN13477.1 hypothetical protein EHR08_11515 [Leptospira bandrabouensis]